MKRSQNAILQRASVLGIKTEYHFWTETDVQNLKECYIKHGRAACFELFPKRTKSSIISKIDSLDVESKIKYFTPEELQIIKDNYEVRSWQEMQELLPGRSRSAIAKKAAELGLKSCYNKPWVEEEIELLKTDLEVPNRSFAMCLAKCRELDIYHKIYRPIGHFWSAEEDEILRKYYPSMGRKVSEMLSRSPECCGARAAVLKIKADPHKPNTANGKKVVCVETGEIFESGAEARRKYHCGDLSQVLNGKRATAGKLVDGTKLHWKYVEEAENKD